MKLYKICFSLLALSSPALAFSDGNSDIGSSYAREASQPVRCTREEYQYREDLMMEKLEKNFIEFNKVAHPSNIKETPSLWTFFTKGIFEVSNAYNGLADANEDLKSLRGFCPRFYSEKVIREKLFQVMERNGWKVDRKTQKAEPVMEETKDAE